MGEALADDGGLVVLRETARWAVVEKPAGLLSVPGVEVSDSVQTRARARWPGATGPITVHRLDMDTSGVILVALDAVAQRALSVQFQDRRVEKGYEALLEGEVEGESGVIDLPMRLDVDRRPMQVVDFARGKAAVTRWRVMGREAGPWGARTRVWFEPETGRSHQLRVHAAARRRIAVGGGTRAGGLGAAIVGDPLYGRVVEDGARMCLHASALGFRDPETGAWVRVESSAGF